MIPFEEYHVHFEITYETKYGENLYILGNIEDLGKWKELKVKMKWTEGHKWIKDLVLNEAIFEYKFVVFNQHTNEKLWEDGNNRVCDLNLCDSSPIHLKSYWNKYIIKFSVFYPLPDAKNEIMRINGDPEELGFWNKLGPIQMSLSSTPRTLPTGEKRLCWEYTTTLPTSTHFLKYKYSILNTSTDTAIWEREPTRFIKLSTSPYLQYKLENAELISDSETKEDLIVNGIVDKLDVNLVLDLEFDEVEGEHIVIGPYPQSKQDVGVLVEYGVNAVINLQTDVDMNHRGVLWARMVKEYRKCGVQGVNFQIHDFNQGDLVRKLPEAARVMRQFISQGMKVYVHCTAGMGRAPSVAIAYLCIYKKMLLEDAYDLVKRYRTCATPNKVALQKGIDLANEFEEEKD